MSKLLLVAVLALGLPCTVLAGPFEDGQAAFRGGDYAMAMRLWHPLAEQGDAAAQASIGFMYNFGRGVPQDYASALRWYHLAANQGHADAQIDLGIMYENGHGVAEDAAEALRWYRRAADQGEAPAQLVLGILYAEGRGVPQDYVQAHVWASLAAAGFELGGNRDHAASLRDFAAARMTPAQIAEAERRARERDTVPVPR